MVKPGQLVYLKIPVQTAAGAATNADSTPTALFYRNNVVDGTVTVTVATSGTTGSYNASLTIPSSGYSAGDSLQVVATAIVGGITGPPTPVWGATLDTLRVSDIPAAVLNSLTSGLTTVGSIGKLIVDNLNATVSSRSTYAGGDTTGTTTLLSRIASALTITGGKVDVNDKSGFSLATAPPTAAEVAVAVWAAGTRSLTTFGTLAADVTTAVWGATTRTLSAFGFTVATNLDSDYARRTGDYATSANVTSAQAALETAIGTPQQAGSAVTLPGTLASDYARRTGDYATTANVTSAQSVITTAVGTPQQAGSAVTLPGTIATDYARRTGDYATAGDVSITVTPDITVDGGFSSDDRDKLNALTPNSGDGSRNWTFTLTNDDDDPIEGGVVRITKLDGSEEFVAASLSDGTATLHPNDFTYNYVANATGFDTASGQIVVTGNGTTPLQLSPNMATLPESDDPELALILCDSRNFAGELVEGLLFRFEIIENDGPVAFDKAFDPGSPVDVRTGEDGKSQTNIEPSTRLPEGATYQCTVLREATKSTSKKQLAQFPFTAELGTSNIYDLMS